MKDFSHIGVAILRTEMNTRVIVRSMVHPIYKGDIVEFKALNKVVRADVIHSAFLPIGCEEETMLAEFGVIHEVEKIYSPRWEKVEEVIEDGN